MTKQEVFNFLNSGIDKSGYLKKEIGFKKKFPELYDEFLNSYNFYRKTFQSIIL